MRLLVPTHRDHGAGPFPAFRIFFHSKIRFGNVCSSRRWTQRPFAADGEGAGGSRGGGRARSRPGTRITVRSDGEDHLGSSLSTGYRRRFPGPPPGEGPPLRVLPIGGLGEIGMNCMLIGAYDRYILVDAGLMFPDFSDLGMQKILPDTSFLAQWRDKIEGVVITHGHEDHIGALPWVVPALDPATPIYAGGMSMQLIKRRLQEFNLWEPSRMHTLSMREPFRLGPFEVEPVRVTHSIPDCCGLIIRSEYGTIVHTGDWKIDESPIDGELFDRSLFESLGNENVALFMSDSTNVLSPGRTTSEADVERALIRRVLGHAGKGRVITTQFASNLHRLASVKKAADASGRKICFVGMSLNTYLEAAFQEGRAPIDPRHLVPQSAMDDMDPNELLVVTTGSQAEPRAALSLASRRASHLLKLRTSDLLLYSAKVIPGNDTKVMQMMNRIAELGPEIAMGRDEGLHTSGHAYRGELEEVLRYVKPQHFLPVHGEYAFLCAHAQLARENGVKNTSVIRNGQMLGVYERRNKNTVSSGSMALLGEAKLVNFYNDGNKGTGTAAEMALEQRQLLAVEGIVVAAVDVVRDPSVAAALLAAAASLKDGALQAAAAQTLARKKLSARVRITTRAMWTDNGKLLERLHAAAEVAVGKLPGDASLAAVERVVSDSLARCCKQFNNRRPEVVVVAHEADPRLAAAMAAASKRKGTSKTPRQGMPGARVDSEVQRGRAGRQYRDVEEEEEEKEKESIRRRRQQREKDLLFAGRGGDVEELGTAAEVDDDEEEDEEEGEDGLFKDESYNEEKTDSAEIRANKDFDIIADVAPEPTGVRRQRSITTSESTAAGETKKRRGSSIESGRRKTTGRSTSLSDRLAQRGNSNFKMGERSELPARERAPPPLQRLPPGMIRRRRANNPRDSPSGDGNENIEYP